MCVSRRLTRTLASQFFFFFYPGQYRAVTQRTVYLSASQTTVNIPLILEILFASCKTSVGGRRGVSGRGCNQSRKKEKREKSKNGGRLTWKMIDSHYFFPLQTSHFQKGQDHISLRCRAAPPAQTKWCQGSDTPPACFAQLPTTERRKY